MSHQLKVVNNTLSDAISTLEKHAVRVKGKDLNMSAELINRAIENLKDARTNIERQQILKRC